MYLCTVTGHLQTLVYNCTSLQRLMGDFWIKMCKIDFFCILCIFATTVVALRTDYLPYLLVLPKPINPGSQLVFWSFHSIHHFFFQIFLFHSIFISSQTSHTFSYRAPFFYWELWHGTVAAFAKHQSDCVFLSEALKSAFTKFDWARVIMWGFNCLPN